MNRDCGLPDKEELISFPRESTYSIGNVPYRLQSHFREDGTHLPEMEKRVLLDNIRKISVAHVRPGALLPAIPSGRKPRSGNWRA